MVENISQESCQLQSLRFITCFHLIAWSLHVKHGVLPSYSSIIVNVRRCELVLRQSCFYSCWILPAAAAAAAAAAVPAATGAGSSFVAVALVSGKQPGKL